MAMSVDELAEQARALLPAEKLRLVDHLMLQLELPDSGLEAVWAEEVGKRRAAYLAGKLPARPYEEVMQRLRAR